MAKSAASAPRRNYLDGWMKLLGAKNKDLAPAARVTPSYISNLRRNARKPTVDVMLAISEALRVSVNDLYRPAPAESAVATLREYAPETLRTITKRARRA